MKKILIISFAILAFNATAQKGKMFPSVIGTTLDDKKANLPMENGKSTIIAIAFNRSAEEDLKKWLNPLYDNFMKKEKTGNFDMAELYDVNFIFVPMISGFKKIAQDFKKGTDKEFWPHIMDTEKTDVNELQKQLGVEDNKIPYFFVVNKDGKIVEMVSGKFTDDKLEKIEDAIE
ncbi:hypothetical protein CNR22_10150 [Sphingobacteriaceae bacterium]|nr:hypothetical protein CNR22_10150 [Sphingobacteriaceae bacterium]